MALSRHEEFSEPSLVSPLTLMPRRGRSHSARLVTEGRESRRVSCQRPYLGPTITSMLPPSPRADRGHVRMFGFLCPLSIGPLTLLVAADGAFRKGQWLQGARRTIWLRAIHRHASTAPGSAAVATLPTIRR